MTTDQFPPAQASDEPMRAEKHDACPFCNSQQTTVYFAGGGSWKAVMCDICEAEGPPAEDEADAITAWNRRAALKAQPAPTEARPLHEEIVREGGMLVCTACGTTSKEPAWEKLPEIEFEDDGPEAPTEAQRVPAIPGTVVQGEDSARLDAPAGWKMVPKRITSEMLEELTNGDGKKNALMKMRYHGMLSVAPKVPPEDSAKIWGFFGSVDINGNWNHNPRLSLTRQEQAAHNAQLEQP